MAAMISNGETNVGGAGEKKGRSPGRVSKREARGVGRRGQFLHPIVMVNYCAWGDPKVGKEAYVVKKMKTTTTVPIALPSVQNLSREKKNGDH